MNTTTKQPVITVIGSTNMDVVCRVPSIPRPGQTITDGVLSHASGGKGANQAVAAARSGATVHFITCIGSDDHGTALRRTLLNEGISLYPEPSATPCVTGTALILVDDQGENAIAVAPGANNALAPSHIDACRGLIAASDLVLLQMEVPPATVAHGLAVAAELRTPAVLNCAPTRGLMVALSDAIALLIVNESEAAELVGEKTLDRDAMARAAERFLSAGVGAVAITLAAEGVALFSPGFTGIIPGLPIQPIDTTGAGDAFCGAITAELARNRPLATAATYACAAAALTCQGLGAQTSIPGRQQIIEFMNAHQPA